MIIACSNLGANENPSYWSCVTKTETGVSFLVIYSMQLTVVAAVVHYWPISPVGQPVYCRVKKGGDKAESEYICKIWTVPGNQSFDPDVPSQPR